MKGKKQGRAGILTAIVLAFLASVLLFLAIWVFRTWTGLTMEEILFHLQAPLTGTGGGMIENGIMHTFLPAGLVLAADAALCMLLKRKKGFGLFLRIQRILSILLIAGTFIFSWQRLALGAYISSQMNVSSFIKDNYADPDKTRISFPEKKRNLIYIYMESMETTYSSRENGGAFGQDIIPELTELARENEDFSGNSQELEGAAVLPAGTYTMAAIFSQSAGLPMKVDIADNFTDKRGSFNSMDTQTSFFPGAVTLGDILKDEGYRQVFLLGSDASFGGRRLFFQTHGDFEIRDYNWALEQGIIPEDYYVFWGYEDEKLFENARQTLQELSSSEEPFNLTMLTVDTHFEDGYACRLCDDRFGSNHYANALACSSRQVAQFINWVKEQDFYENTTIVLCGDHLTMDSDFCADISQDYERKAYTAYINAAAEPANPDRDRSYSTLDAFPTTLAALGCTIEGDRLGLGTNIFSDQDTVMETYGAEKLTQELERRSPFMEGLAQIDPYNTALLKRRGMLPRATMAITSFKKDAGRMDVQVLNIKNVWQDIKKVKVTAQDTEGRSLEVTCRKGEASGAYIASLDLSRFDYTFARLTASAVFADGQSYELGTIAGDLSLKKTDFNTYLGVLAENPQYCILAAVKDDASRLFSPVMEMGMAKLGFVKSLYHHFRCSYYGVVTPQGLLAEDRSEESLSCEGKLPDEAEYAIISQGGNSGAGVGAGRYLTCSIKIDGQQYALQRVGINLVVYDSQKHRVVDSVCFNTNNSLACRRMDLTPVFEAQAASQEGPAEEAPSASKEGSADEAPSASQEGSAKEAPSASKEGSAENTPSGDKLTARLEADLGQQAETE